MAILNSDISVRQNSGLLKDRVVNNQNINGDLRFLTATYTTTGAELANDVINIAAIPVGARVVADFCRVSTDGVGGTGAAIAKLGDAASDNRYSATSIAIVSAGTTLVTPVAAFAVAPTPVTAGNEVIKATVALSSGSFTAGKKITFRLAYLLP